MTDFIDALADNLDEGLLLGDPAREVSDDRLGSIKVAYTTLENPVPTSSKPGAPTFDPGDSLADLYKGPRKCEGGKTCSGVVLELIQYQENLITVEENQQDSNVEVDDSQVWYASPAIIEKLMRDEERKAFSEPSCSRGR